MSDYGTIVVGGGVIGAATAHHLSQAGGQKVLLLERNGVSEGTTPAGAGFICVWAAGNIPAWKQEEMAFERYALSFYRELSARGHDIDLHTNGHIWIGITEDGYSEHIEPMAVDENVADKRVLDAKGVAELLPIVDPGEIVGGVYHPGSIYLSTSLVTEALAREAAAAGAEIRTHSPVSELLVEDGRVRGVRTAAGELKADNVVLALGAWTNSLLKQHEKWLPIAPVTATRIITEPLGLPSTLPSFLLPEMHQMWIREHAGGLLFGGDYEGRPHYDFVDVDPPSSFRELPLDGYEEERELASRAAAAVPLLGEFKSATVTTGAPVMTPDFRPLAGPVPGLAGAWVITGDCECGVTHGPGLARTVSELIFGEEPTLAEDPAALDPGRFGDSLKTGADVLKAMANAEGGVWKIDEAPRATA